MASYQKKKRNRAAADYKEKVKVERNADGYTIEAEIGRLEVETDRIRSQRFILWNANGQVFPRTGPKEMLRSACYDELELTFAKDNSYRVCAEYLNRLRWQDDQKTTKSRTVADAVVREGNLLVAHLDKKAETILVEHGFDPQQGTPLPETSLEHATDAPQATLDLEQAVQEYNEGRQDKLLICPEDIQNEVFESSAASVYVSVDDVGVKQQKPSGRQKNPPPKKTKPRVTNTVIHIQKSVQRYILDGIGVRHVLVILAAFLLYNDLFSRQTLVFFADGADDIKKGIQDIFGWRPHRIILDWYHLIKKCQERSSMAMKGRHVRNDMLEQLLPLLWLGKVSEAVTFLQNLDSQLVRCPEHIERLIAYLERNRAHIPCYAMRKHLGLRNSSNRGEKANDMVVAQRQKHNGMSWSKPGSSGLANVTTMFLNGESEEWLARRNLRFKMTVPLRKSA